MRQMVSAAGLAVTELGTWGIFGPSFKLRVTVPFWHPDTKELTIIEWGPWLAALGYRCDMMHVPAAGLDGARRA